MNQTSNEVFGSFVDDPALPGGEVDVAEMLGTVAMLGKQAHNLL